MKGEMDKRGRERMEDGRDEMRNEKMIGQKKKKE